MRWGVDIRPISILHTRSLVVNTSLSTYGGRARCSSTTTWHHKTEFSARSTSSTVIKWPDSQTLSSSVGPPSNLLFSLVFLSFLVPFKRKTKQNKTDRQTKQPKQERAEDRALWLNGTARQKALLIYSKIFFFLSDFCRHVTCIVDDN